MAITSHNVEAFVRYTCSSLSFKISVIYLLMVAISRKWKKLMGPLQLNRVSIICSYSLDDELKHVILVMYREV